MSESMVARSALIPACNDAYTLEFCLGSIGPYFDEIVVLNDNSVDATAEVVARARTRWAHIAYHEHRGPHLGSAQARNRLLELARGDKLFFLDADDVLCEYNAHLLDEVMTCGPVVHLQLAEMWGDFEHTTQRLVHYDPCHIYVDRSRVRDMRWVVTEQGHDYPECTARRSGGPGPLFWHIKGVKPDWRLVLRRHYSEWKLTRSRDAPLDYVLGANSDEIHRHAVDRLLHADGDDITRYTGDPPRPAVIEDAPARFEMVYENGQLVERLDHGWWATGVSKDMRCLVKRPQGLCARRLDGNRFSVRTGEGYMAELNVSAMLVWELCDGFRSIRGIADQLAAAYGLDPAAALADVAATVSGLSRHRLVQMCSVPVAGDLLRVDDQIV